MLTASDRRILQPQAWLRPKGYANGIAVSGLQIYVAGQVGWEPDGKFAEGLVAQTELALRNILTVLGEAEAGPADIVRLTWYVIDIDDYEARQKEMGEVYRRLMGRNFPTMSLIQVVRLVERAALVEIEATAVKPL